MPLPPPALPSRARPPDDEGDHRVGVCGGSRCHCFRQLQAWRRVQYCHRLPGLELQLAADVHALSMRPPCGARQSPRETRRPAPRVSSEPRLRRTSEKRHQEIRKVSSVDVGWTQKLPQARYEHLCLHPCRDLIPRVDTWRTCRLADGSVRDPLHDQRPYANTCT